MAATSIVWLIQNARVWANTEVNGEPSPLNEWLLATLLLDCKIECLSIEPNILRS